MLTRVGRNYNTLPKMDIGHYLSHPLPGDEVVVTGIAGYFPESDSVSQLQENLFNKVDLVTDDDRRWSHRNLETPHRSGKINKIENFDASFFGMNYIEGQSIEPMSRLLLERAYEAIIDAGVNPEELRDSRTGVIVGSYYYEAAVPLLYKNLNMNQQATLGTSHNLLATRIAQWLGVRGPSYTVDTACSSSTYAIEQAFKAIRNGECDNALVCGAHLCLLAKSSTEFLRAGILSLDGRCKSFDKSADGYVRSEAVAVAFLQKAKDSRRAYTQIVYAKTNCDGYKESGFSHPSGEMQKRLLQQVYQESSTDPHTVEYVEAHGTGTNAGDPQELGSFDLLMSEERPKPLLLGCVKSNLGHTEAASGLTALAKLCIAYHTGYIPPNLHFTRPNEIIEDAIRDGKLKVVTEKQPWDRGLACFSGFGIAGANAHVLVKNFNKEKVNNGLPNDVLPRLICVSGRTQCAVQRILDSLSTRPIDVEEVRLWHAIHEKDINGHGYRGYVLLKSTSSATVELSRGIQRFTKDHRPVCLVYSDDPFIEEMATDLMNLPAFAACIDKCHKTLLDKNINLREILDYSKKDNDMNKSITSIVAVQIALTDVFRAVGLELDYCIGYGAGKICCAYANNFFTLEEAISVAYLYERSLNDNVNLTVSVTVELEHEKRSTFYPSNVHVESIGPRTSKITGPLYIMEKFIDQAIKEEGIKIKEVTKNHSIIAQPSSELLSYLKKIVTKVQNQKSISHQKTKKRETMFSAEEFYNELMNLNIMLEKEMSHVSEEAIIINLGNLNQINLNKLQDLHTNTFKNETQINIFAGNIINSVNELLKAFGRLYEEGINLKLANLYPAVPFPVSQGTPMLSHLVEWDHRGNWFRGLFKNFNHKSTAVESTHTISLDNPNYEYLKGHALGGRILFPGTGYLDIVWKTLASSKGRDFQEVSVVFENITFHRATTLSGSRDLHFNVIIHPVSGEFEVSEKQTTVATGIVYEKQNVGESFADLSSLYKYSNTYRVSQKDFLKEVRIRGYEYSGIFKGLLSSDITSYHTRVHWPTSTYWDVYLDYVLQSTILSYDTRNFYVPTRIKKLCIDTELHHKSLKTESGAIDTSIDVYFDKHSNVIRSGGVEVRGCYSTLLPRKSPIVMPVYEKYVFVPNINKTIMKFDDAIYCNVGLILENLQGYKFQAIEFSEDIKNASSIPVIAEIDKFLNNAPMVRAELTLVTEKPVQISNNIVVAKSIAKQKNAVLLIGASLLRTSEILNSYEGYLRENGFILSVEKTEPNLQLLNVDYDIITSFRTNENHLVLLRKKQKFEEKVFINVSNKENSFSWINESKNAMEAGNKIVFYGQDELSGVLGFVNCLRKEQTGSVVHALYIDDVNDVPPFNPNNDFYKEQLDKDLAFNVLQNGEWGTYRHILVKEHNSIEAVEHAFVNIDTIGDLSTLGWYEGCFRDTTDEKPVEVHVYCAALNFRDVVVASGRVPVDAVSRSRLRQQYIQGLEIAGRTSDGNRVIGTVDCQGIATTVYCSADRLFCVPDEWTLEEAVTLPIAYCTVYLAFEVLGKMKRGESVLIHAGTGGVGQAAIYVALSYGCEIFTTVGSQEKRDFIKKQFPELKDSHIGSTRDTTFEEMINRETKGKGVDLVLNSLADDKLIASIRCLGYRGRFLELGKYDIFRDTSVDMGFHDKEISFHGVMFDYAQDYIDLQKKLIKLVLRGVAEGAVRPLTYCVFEKDEVEAANRYLAAGKHIGKVVIKIRDEPINRSEKPVPVLINAQRRLSCQNGHVYVIVGGLGGFGLELADWLVLRGARKLLLVSRNGVSTGYQAQRIRIWETYGCNIKVSTDDVTTHVGCANILKSANSMGHVDAIFNLAAVLKDALFQQQTPETFRASFEPKAVATKLLDELSRELCPGLRYFVVFSSLACGRGNTGQSNYGMANSVMERICERRRRDGFPGLAIQWGVIGDVGLLADMQIEERNIEISGTIPQRIQSCLKTLDRFLVLDVPVAATYVLAEKKVKGHQKKTPLGAVLEIMGIKNLKSISYQTKLAELGMDSMTALEIKQTLDRDFEINLTPDELRSLTLARLDALSETESEQVDASVKEADTGTDSLRTIIKNFGKEENAYKPFMFMSPVTSVENKQRSSAENTLFMIPGIEGFAAAFDTLCRNLNTKSCVLQFPLDQHADCIQAIVDKLHQTIMPMLSPGMPFNILGYSFGTIPLIELVARLENEGHHGKVFCIDGSPTWIKAQTKKWDKYGNETELYNNIIKCYNIIIPEGVHYSDAFKDKVNRILKNTGNNLQYSDEFLKKMATVFVYRMKSIKDYNPDGEVRIESPITLIRSENNLESFDMKYNLENFTSGAVDVYVVKSDHETIMEVKDCADIINKCLKESSLE